MHNPRKRYSSESGVRDTKFLKLDNKENINMDMNRLPPYKKGVATHLSKIEGELHSKLVKLSKVMEGKQEEVQNLKNRLMTLKTQKANYEFEKFKIDDELSKLKGQKAILDGNIEELKSHEKESLKNLENKYELESKEKKLLHQNRLDKLKNEASSQIETIILESFAKLTAEKAKLIQECNEKTKEIRDQEQDLNRKLIKLKEGQNKRLLQREAKLDEEMISLSDDSQVLKDKTAEFRSKISQMKQELNTTLKAKHDELSSTLDLIKTQHCNREKEIETISETLFTIEEDMRNMRARWQVASSDIDTYKDRTRLLQIEIEQKEMKRRILHNKLQELKGNIRVFCRMRPPNLGEKVADIEYPNDEVNADSNQELVISKDKLTESFSGRNATSYKFQFDKIFPPELKNEAIFDELSQLVQSSLDGFNVSVFAYGQTGSGKTFTMSNDDNGMIPLSIKKIYDDIEELKLRSWSYSVEGQFVEIYNETVNDLLGPINSGLKHEIKHDEDRGKTSITNITPVKISSVDEAYAILRKANKRRSTMSTKINERSSRSHSIFMFSLYGVNTKTDEKREGTLNLIDLAGSERIAISQVKGDRLKETQAINKSLSYLGDVINSLGQRQNQTSSQQHIPYRNSKLTYLLKNSLGGNSKTLMFVNVSPMVKDFSESLNSLRFATKVNNTKLETSSPSKRSLK